jgi:dephospho-CoA kinase
MILGITGTIGAGKGTVVSHLVEHRGFHHISARAIWTDELNQRGLPVDRDHMTVLANELRAEHGPAFFVEQALTRCVEGIPCVIESIRTIAEAELLAQRGGVLLAIDADKQVRYERIHSRGTSLDDVTYEDFVRQEETEMSNDDPNKQNLAAVMQLADHTIRNNNDMEALRADIEAFLDIYL